MGLYQGTCHCGRIRFEVDATIDHVRVCDCSICRRRGALIFRIENDQLTLHSPWPELSVYQWGARTATDYFCPECGILPFRKPAALNARERAAGIPEFTGWAVNVRCLEGLDLFSLPIKNIPGSRL